MGSPCVRLLAHGPDVNTTQGDGATALHWAVYWDDHETAELLIHAGADVDAANDYEVTPLWLACANASGAMVERLLAAGADAKATLTTGETALMACARTGSVDAVEALLKRGVEVDSREASERPDRADVGRPRNVTRPSCGSCSSTAPTPTRGRASDAR